MALPAKRCTPVLDARGFQRFINRIVLCLLYRVPFSQLTPWELLSSLRDLATQAVPDISTVLIGGRCLRWNHWDQLLLLDTGQFALCCSNTFSCGCGFLFHLDTGLLR